MTTFWPSTYPASRSPSRNAAALNEYGAADALFRNPTTGTGRACPRAARTYKIGEAPSSVRTLRRFIRDSLSVRFRSLDYRRRPSCGRRRSLPKFALLFFQIFLRLAILQRQWDAYDFGPFI